ncbi:steroid delta-isomerase-like uncharacterized protein [Humitalea rosea]|uniref:Steroid delta-isomerase-like uncharacterized protein n=1 Tax=Humitalea rosea TaxID=990373 RepID=A0A2W7J278_9PROT|nr:ketosteroid isomerase-related protein [Humitalea rosea]PZW45087.1 steroid delta-isomerase-like uncharacterized protein [Humitalea rosea]
MHATETLVRRYYDAFNRADWPGMLALLTEDVVHDINQGGRETGRAAFASFLGWMGRAYREQLTGMVVMVDATGTRAAAEFTVTGTYLIADAGMPPAHGQGYVLPAGAFLEIRDGRIARVTTCYDVNDWKRQVERGVPGAP